MKNLMGAPSSNTNEMQELANKCTEGDMTQLVNSMNDFFMSVSADLPRLDSTHRVFVSNIGYPNGGVPEGTLSGPNNCLVQINELQTPCPIFKYVDDSTIFDVCNSDNVPISQLYLLVVTNYTALIQLIIHADVNLYFRMLLANS